MSSLFLTVASAKRIHARAYNNVRLLRMKDFAQRRGCGATIVDDHVQVRTRVVELDGKIVRNGFRWQGVYNWGQMLELFGLEENHQIRWDD